MLTRRNFLIGASSAAVAVGAGLTALRATVFGIDFGSDERTAYWLVESSPSGPSCVLQKMQNEFRKRQIEDMAFYGGQQWTTAQVLAFSEMTAND